MHILKYQCLTQVVLNFKVLLQFWALSLKLQCFLKVKYYLSEVLMIRMPKISFFTSLIAYGFIVGCKSGLLYWIENSQNRTWPEIPSFIFLYSIGALSIYPHASPTLNVIFVVKYSQACTDPEGGGGTGGPDIPPPIKNHKNIASESLSNTGPDPLKFHKAAKQAFNVGPSSAR